MNYLKLKKRLSGDHDFKSHTILGSMCTEPHPLAIKTYKRFLSTNVGDPGLFPNLVELEKEYIRLIGNLLNNNDSMGMVVSGGSEANILAMWSARELAKKNQRDVLVSEACHFSFDKAAQMLNLNLIKIKVDAEHKVCIDLLKEQISENTMAIVGIAGTTGAGACDSIDELSEIALEHNIYLHVDAAFGGFVYPFIEKSPAFDFSLPGVQSITLDPHKMGRAVIQSGCILYRNKDIYNSVNITIDYLSGGKTTHNSILGTRSGASIAASWAIYNYLGLSGYKAGIDKLMKLTSWFVDKIKDINGIDTIIEPQINIVGICTTNNMDIKVLINKLRLKGWAISEWNNFMRITVMPHVKKSYLKRFLNDIESIMSCFEE